MKTKPEIRKKFDAVAFMRKRRDEIAREIAGMSPEKEIEYFQKKSKLLKKA
jgi:hypothetical protein